MKKNTHPTSYRTVVFIDINYPDSPIFCKSTMKTDKKTLIEGVEYDTISVDTSFLTHPFYTGKSNYITRAGRIDKFNKKYSKFSSPKEAKPEEEKDKEKA